MSAGNPSKTLTGDTAPLTTLRVPEFGLNDTPEDLRARVAETLERGGFAAMARRFRDACDGSSWTQVLAAAAPFVRVVYGPKPVPAGLILTLAALIPVQSGLLLQGGAPLSLHLGRVGAELRWRSDTGSLHVAKEKGDLLSHLGPAPSDHQVQSELVEVAAQSFGWPAYEWVSATSGPFAGGSLLCLKAPA